MGRYDYLNEKSLDRLETKLDNYKTIESKINKRRMELTKTSHGTFEDNIGASKSNTVSSPVEAQVIKFDEDSRLTMFICLSSQRPRFD